MVRRLLGYATTDGSGVAILNYVGQGLGELDIVAESGGEILFHYEGVGGTETDSFYYNTTDIQVSASSTGTTVTNVGSTGRTYWANMGDTSSSSGDEWNTPLIVECDIVSASANVSIQFVKDNNTVARNCSELGITNGGHIKVVLDGSTAKYYVNGSDTASYTANWSMSDFSIRFYVVNGQSFKYKNFFIYRGSTQLTSDPIQLLDCQFYDKGLSSDYNNNWNNVNQTRITVTRDETGTTLTGLDGSSYNYWTRVNSVNNDKWLTGTFAVEFDIVSMDTYGGGKGATLQIYDGGAEDSTHLYQKTLGSNYATSGSHIKVVYDGSKIDYYVDNTLKNTENGVDFTAPVRVGFKGYGNWVLKFKEFKIYPI